MQMKLNSVMAFFIMLSVLQPLFGQVGLPTTYHPATDGGANWRLAIQAWTFNRFTFYEAVDKMNEAGVDWIEAFPGQKLSADKPDVKMDYTMPVELRAEILKKLAGMGMHLVNYGVVDLPNDEKQCRQVFQFAKDLGIETILAEPPEEAFEMIDRLCNEYNIKIAIHNHPKPSHYWNPDKVLEVIQGRSNMIGSASDIGHWMRSGVQPLEALKKLQGRIICLHFKDLNEFGNPDAHDVPWGTGKANTAELLAELNRQNFKGVFSIEYEYNWDNSLPEVKQCVDYFNRVAGELNPSGWHNLFAADLANGTFTPGAWTVDEGMLTWHGGSYIWSKEKYGDFILDVEYKVSPNANSGIFFRTGSLDDVVNTGIELQIHETTDGTPRGMCGAIYDVMAPSKNVAKKAGEWNHYTITCKANKIYVVQNGEQIIDMDLNNWTQAHKNPDGSANKFNKAYKDMPREGFIGFQDHGQPVWFRNIKIKKL
jgi:sugar phosphate isomerase/epimerase